MSVDYANQTTVSDNEPQECLDLVRNLFSRTASVLRVAPFSEAIPEPLRYPGAKVGVWKSPEQIIGVECGLSSEGLCAIISPDKKCVLEFIADNPAFGSSLITSWPSSSSYHLWARSDWLPANTCMDGIWLVSKGVVPVAVPGLDLTQFVAQQGPVPVISFANIKWPPGLADRFRIILLQQAFGPPHRLSSCRKAAVNKMFWGHFLAEKLGLIQHARQQTFLRRETEGQVPEPIALDDLMRLMLLEIQQMARQHLTDFPLDAVGVPCLKRIMEVVRIVA
jgi:hypothetical protein